LLDSDDEVEVDRADEAAPEAETESVETGDDGEGDNDADRSQTRVKSEPDAEAEDADEEGEDEEDEDEDDSETDRDRSQTESEDDDEQDDQTERESNSQSGDDIVPSADAVVEYPARRVRETEAADAAGRYEVPDSKVDEDELAGKDEAAAPRSKEERLEERRLKALSLSAFGRRRTDFHFFVS
jgi:hypothetical protein